MVRSKKAVSCIYKFFYFTFAVTWGYVVLKDTDYLPPSLGGSGDISKVWNNVEAPIHAPGMKMYTLVTMGYHVGGLVTHLIAAEKGNDYLEMALHHFVAFYLFFGYYLSNMWEMGMTIAFLHDIADVTTNILKPISNTKYANLSVFIFIVHMFMWGWTRLYVLPV